MHTLIIGHSFISRLEAFLSASNSPTANLNISSLQSVHFVHKSGAKLTGPKFQCLLHDTELYLATQHCQIIYISLGTNDLDSGMHPTQVASRLFHLALTLYQDYNPRYVFIEQIVNRNQEIFPNFAPAAKLANQALQAILERSGFQNIQFWRLHNLNNPQKPALLDDGVHFNERGMRKYRRAIRGAILCGRN